MTKTLWIVLMLFVPILIPLSLFGLCGPMARSAGIGLLKFYLACMAIVFVIMAIGGSFK
jgi:hypothetical protein